MKGVEHWLEKDGVFVLEVGYFVDVYSNTWFDTIYHEHVDYHTVAPFEKLFERSQASQVDFLKIELVCLTCCKKKEENQRENRAGLLDLMQKTEEDMFKRVAVRKGGHPEG